MPDAAPVAAPVVPSTAPVANGAAPVEAKGKPTQTVEEYLEWVEDGKPVKVTKAEALKRLSKSGFADQRTKQAADAIKAAKQREAEWAEEQKLLETDEEAYLRKKGRDPEALARKILEKKLRDAELNDDQRAALTEKQRADAAEAKVKEFTERQEEAQLIQQAEKVQALMISDLSAAAGRAGWVITDANRGEVIDLLREEVKDSFEAGFPVDSEWADRIVEAAKRKHDQTFERLETAVTKGLTGEALVKRLGQRVVDEVLKHRLSEIRGKKTFGQAKPTEKEIAPVTKQNQYLNPREADEQLRKLRGIK